MANPLPSRVRPGRTSGRLSNIQSLHTGHTGGSLASRAALSALDEDNNTAIIVDAVFHIVAKEESKGDITNDMPQAQLDSLKAAYKDYGIQFDLINVTWNTNDAWATGEKDADLDMKKQLRQGTYRTRNIYFQTELAGGVLGRCTLPSNIANGKSDPTVYSNNGCNVSVNVNANTSPHLRGYSCDGLGDYIDDTPYERESTDGCPDSPPKQSCPEQTGEKNDPILNFIDYSTDACYTGFTQPREEQSQHDRMHYMYNTFTDGN
ncbi:hypothetical protein K458DRAFT_440244 [Lentithecium fluviatile CBS 122367]|uniref:Peptidase M43 pregnancy-associated plasma-A domain-containing protein n=1 Tax=Lentithecium fluviatile CBS 122367 TaxID=1168545 RepID=A0A6G1JDX8_9PLEO|nr:hypothetical protein K458DRAFT_440244 [Lentithecium fluviatile CBS 122367]